MAGGDGAEERARPRRHLVDENAFGHDPAASWHPIGAGDDPVEVIAAYWQHLAVCVLRATYGHLLLDELDRRLPNSRDHLQAQVVGRFAVRTNDLIRWALAFDDVTVLPTVDRVDDLYPPGAR